MSESNNLHHWHLQTDADGLLWLGLDRQGTTTNTLGRAVLEELEQVLADLESDPPRGLVLHSLKPTGFIAGADVREFTEIRDEAGARALIGLGQRVCDRLQALPMPTLAAIHGYCLGGGLELALACDYRLADDAAETQLGLPEVKLGIHPGFGGSLRSTRLLGAPAALDLMLTGRAVDGRKARRLGLVDHCVPQRQLRNAARRVVLDAPRRHRPGWTLALTNFRPLRGLIASRVRARLRDKVDPAHYPAPYALLDLWQQHGGNRRRMLEGERDSVARLFRGTTAPNLVRLFLLRERLKSLGRNEAAPPRHLHVVGAGVMGGDIAAWCALRGLSVSLQDQRPEALARAMTRARELFERRLRRPHRVRAAMDRLIPDLRGAGVAKADVVLEAVFEDAAVKRDLLRSLEPRLKPNAWLATNTSSIPLETLGEVLRHPQRLVGLHFFNPVAKMPLVEVVRTAGTSDLVLQRALAFARAIDRLPLPVRSAPGFLVNRLLMPYLLEAMHLYEEGKGEVVIDQAARDFGMPVGPLELADVVGLDICHSTALVFAEGFGIAIPASLRERVEQGRLGRKSGDGFYHWEHGKAVAHHGGRTVTAGDRQLQDRLILPMLNQALRCLREGIVADADLVDAGMVFGAGFAPFRGGPMRYIESTGRATLHARLGKLARRHGERFRPDPGWLQADPNETDERGEDRPMDAAMRLRKAS